VHTDREQPVDKDALRAAIEEARTFTIDSWFVFAPALMYARRIYNDPNATQAEVYEATSNLNAALRGLVRRNPENPDDVTRYNVLVIDVSGSMWGAPMQAARSATQRFVDAALGASGTNYVAIVAFGGRATIRSEFTNIYYHSLGCYSLSIVSVAYHVPFLYLYIYL